MVLFRSVILPGLRDIFFVFCWQVVMLDIYVLYCHAIQSVRQTYIYVDVLDEQRCLRARATGHNLPQ